MLTPPGTNSSKTALGLKKPIPKSSESGRYTFDRHALPQPGWLK
jgi:hypothetical protein